MIRSCSFLFFLLISPVLFASPVRRVSYTVSPLKKGDYHSLLVTMTFKGNSSGHTTLTIPYETGNARPQDHFAILTISNANKHQPATNDSSVYSIEHKPGALLTVTYTITNALKDSLPTAGEVNAQMLTGNYFYLTGSAIWAVPNDSSGTPYDIHLKWKGLPAAWSYLNSFGTNKVNQRINATLDDFQNAIYMAGDFRIHKLVINDRPLYFGIRGQWNFNDEEVFDIIKRTVSSQRAYWNDYDVDRYTIALLPMKHQSDDEKSITGRGFTNTFATIGTNSKAFGLNDLVFLYNHELMHHWLGHVLKQGEPENAFKWFHEGFTDYFAHVVMMEEGLLDQPGFKKRINTIVAAYYNDSTHQWPNKKLEEDYWSTYEMQQLPYKRGLIFAFYLNESIQRQTGGKASLKDVMLQLFAEARRTQRAFSPAWFLHVLQQTTGHDYASLLDRFITNGTFISMTDWEAVTDNIALAPTAVFDPGFTTDRGIAMNAVITAVAEGSNVQKAGLKVGDVMTGYSAKQQPTDTATLVVKRGEEKIRMQFLPAREVWVPQLK